MTRTIVLSRCWSRSVCSPRRRPRAYTAHEREDHGRPRQPPRAGTRPGGAVYVAEAGAGGAGPCRATPTNGTRCFGLTGAISGFVNGTQERIVSSDFRRTPCRMERRRTDPNDLSFQNAGDMFAVMGPGFDPVDRRFFGDAGASFGKLLRISPGGQIGEAGDVSAYERDVNPAGPPFDSNPYGVSRCRRCDSSRMQAPMPWSASSPAAWSIR